MTWLEKEEERQSFLRKRRDRGSQQNAWRPPNGQTKAGTSHARTQTRARAATCTDTRARGRGDRRARAPRHGRRPCVRACSARCRWGCIAPGPSSSAPQCPDLWSGGQGGAGLRLKGEYPLPPVGPTARPLLSDPRGGGGGLGPWPAPANPPSPPHQKPFPLAKKEIHYRGRKFEAYTNFFFSPS